MLPTRRTFLYAPAAASLLASQSGGKSPWYTRTLRWGQTNLTEKDPQRYDGEWWRKFWRRTNVQGIIVNAGGIIAYYPSKFPLHYRAEFLEGRDLYGEINKAAREENLVVLARMDSNRASEAFYKAHPDWFAVNTKGEPYRAAEKYVTCINGPYYEEFLTSVLREIIERYKPDGFTDNSWAGLGRESICYCGNCRKKFGRDLPARADWKDRVYREWIQWSYARRLEVWDMNNRVTQAAGGPDCLWAGMISASLSGMSRSFRDAREIGRRSKIIMLDYQYRTEDSSFYLNADAGQMLHGVIGWDKLIPESMPMYQMAGQRSFRVASKPAPEARGWMHAGFAGGIQPWWHHIGAYHEDRRMYHTAEPVLRWHKENEEVLVNRTPLADVGLVWSQRNSDFFGRERPEEQVDQPWRGFAEALLKSRIPYRAVHVDDIEKEAPNLRVLVLPNVAAMTEAQCAAVRRYAEGGGNVVATGATSMCDEWGDALPDLRLGDVLGVHGQWSGVHRRYPLQHTYLRLTPELRGKVDGPKAAGEPADGTRHAVLAGFEETDILPFGGTLEPLRVDSGRLTVLTFIPPFPMFPPETSFMKVERTDIPGLVLRDGHRGRVAYLAADIDRRYALQHLPDHAALLANIVRWAAREVPVRVIGPGLLGLYPYRQDSRLILHILNLTNPGAWRAPVDEVYPMGPLQVEWKLPHSMKAGKARLLVAGREAKLTVRNGWAQVPIEKVNEHEVLVLS